MVRINTPDVSVTFSLLCKTLRSEVGVVLAGTEAELLDDFNDADRVFQIDRWTRSVHRY